MYAGEQLAPPAGIEAAVFRRLDRMRWMRRLAGGLVVSAVAVGGYFAMPADAGKAQPQEVVAQPQPVVAQPVVAESAVAETAAPARVPAAVPAARRSSGTAAGAATAAAEPAAKPEGAPGTARRIDPAQVESGKAVGLQQRAAGEDRWVLPARIEVKD